MQQRYSFQPVGTTRVHSGKCPVCGRSATRSRKFEHTVNPYNRNDDGSVRTADEVYARVKAEADEWVPDFTHAKCAGKDKRP